MQSIDEEVDESSVGSVASIVTIIEVACGKGSDVALGLYGDLVALTESASNVKVETSNGYENEAIGSTGSPRH